MTEKYTYDAFRKPTITDWWGNPHRNAGGGPHVACIFFIFMHLMAGMLQFTGWCCSCRQRIVQIVPELPIQQGNLQRSFVARLIRLLAIEE